MDNLPFEWVQGELIEQAYIEIDGVKHYVTPARYDHGTSLSAYHLNRSEYETIKRLNGEILWTNPNPNDPFLPQEITLSSGDYDVLEWFYRSDVYGNRTTSSRCLKGSSVQFDLFSLGNATRRWGRRADYVSNTQYNVSNTSVFEQGQSTQTTNEQCVPLYVIGYKTGLFGGQS